jgi:hypothetical protein
MGVYPLIFLLSGKIIDGDVDNKSGHGQSDLSASLMIHR